MPAVWSSETVGWIVRFITRPEGLDLLPAGRGPGTKGGLLEQHFVPYFKRLEEMLEGGVIIQARMPHRGYAVLVGPEDACLRLKKKLEDEKFAVMSKNMVYHLIE